MDSNFDLSRGRLNVANIKTTTEYSPRLGSSVGFAQASKISIVLFQILNLKLNQIQHRTYLNNLKSAVKIDRPMNNF